jgi:hypothetical protein
MPGAGKTTVGRQLARRMQRSFIDADHEIEARTGVRIPVIFDIEGEQGFRDRESKSDGRAGSAIGSGSRHGGWRRCSAGKSLRHAPGWSGNLSPTWRRLLYERTRLDPNRPLAAGRRSAARRSKICSPCAIRCIARLPTSLSTAWAAASATWSSRSNGNCKSNAPPDVALGTHSYPILIGGGPAGAVPTLSSLACAVRARHWSAIPRCPAVSRYAGVAAWKKSASP